MNNFKKNIYKSAQETTLDLESGNISSVSQPDFIDGCLLTLDTPCWFDTITNGVITTGDIAYTDSLGSSPVIGANQYYKVSLVSAYVVLIDNLGVMSVSSICA